MAMALNTLQVRRGLEPHEFVLIVTASCISRITDYACQQSGALFGDLSTATLICRRDHPRLPAQLELIDAAYCKQPALKAYFDFDMRDAVAFPTRDGGKQVAARRLVFSLDGMGIADTAPRAMANAASSLLRRNRIDPAQVDMIVPHQAGDRIVEFTQLKLSALGISGEVINGLTRDTGNVSSGSVPYALRQHWSALHGTILCPVAAVGAPGKPEVSQGCVLLRRFARSRAQAA
jgi:3-oxoacyl-[acyl-carrier-protein] synthase-3